LTFARFTSGSAPGSTPRPARRGAERLLRPARFLLGRDQRHRFATLQSAGDLGIIVIGDTNSDRPSFELVALLDIGKAISLVREHAGERNCENTFRTL
jgi:hypothetical protein